MKKIIVISTYLITLMFGFGLGVYFLPIIIAEKSQSIQEIENIKKQATNETEFKRGQRGNDFFHWGEGKVYISNEYISLKGQISPGPDYKIYLLKNFVEHEDEFIPVKSDAIFVSDLKLFKNFVIKVPVDVKVIDYNTILIWCEKFKEFITSAKYK